MAIAVTKTVETVAGNLRMTSGLYTLSGGGTTGDINTGLHKVITMQLSAHGSSIVAGSPTINETFPCDGTAVTIIATANTSGRWLAFGY